MESCIATILNKKKTKKTTKTIIINKLVKKNMCNSTNDKEENTNNNISKEMIIKLFRDNVKGKSFIKPQENKNDGEEGHWLEKLMNLKLNSNNMPDIGGFEMKKNSKKISFGDWSAEYLFSSKRNLLTKFNKEDIFLTKEKFIKFFGNHCKDKPSRYSWSGSCIPKFGHWNTAGQSISIDDELNIIVLYDYSKDKRKDKQTEQLKDKKICIAVWSKEKMEKYVNNKFNQKGFFICKKNKNNIYDKICFGPPINFELFINKIKTGDIFFDSGMYFDSNKPNQRLYSQWRASNKFWNNLIIEEFE